MAKVQVDWHGSFAVIVTPFAADGSIDEAGYRRVVSGVIEAGCHGVISAGSTGEFFLMSDDERTRVFEVAVDEAAGRVPIVACPSATRTEQVIALTKAATKAGCAGAMVLPPIYIGVDDREVVEALTRSIVKKLLHQPTKYLRQGADQSQLQALRELFRMGDDT